MHDVIAIGVTARFLRPELGPGAPLRPAGGRPVTALYWIGLVVVVLLAAYLVVALFEPERF